MDKVSWPTLFAAFLGQVVVAVLTVRLALGRFRQEKWWERKYEAYSEILGIIHKMRKSYFIDLDREERGIEVSHDKIAEERAEYNLGSDSLMRHSDLGDFLISKEAVRVLRRYGKDIKIVGKQGGYVDYLVGSLGVIEELLVNMRAAAKADLKNSWFAAAFLWFRRRVWRVHRNFRQAP